MFSEVACESFLGCLPAPTPDPEVRADNSQVPKLPRLALDCSWPDVHGKVTTAEVGKEERSVGQGGFLVKAPPWVWSGFWGFAKGPYKSYNTGS